MIPKIIHYCWFGHNSKPSLAEKCIKSWKKKCPDYKIIEWNEDNYDISKAPLYVRQAYELKKWAFVTDYVRLQVVYENGGIYLDTDVELKKNLDDLLQYDVYFGFEDGKYVNTGLGFGAVKGCFILQELMDDYKNIPFVLSDGSLDLTPCPERNTKIFLKYGLKQDDSMQYLNQLICILPSIYLCPIDYETNKHRRSKLTISIHWFSGSWLTKEQKRLQIKRSRKKKRAETIDFVKHIPNRLLMLIMGKEKYEKLKHKIKGK